MVNTKKKGVFIFKWSLRSCVKLLRSPWERKFIPFWFYSSVVVCGRGCKFYTTPHFLEGSSIPDKINISFTYPSIRICFTVQICDVLADRSACRGTLHRNPSKSSSIPRGIHSWGYLVGAFGGDVRRGRRNVLAFPSCQQPVAFAGMQQKCKSPFTPDTEVERCKGYNFLCYTRRSPVTLNPAQLSLTVCPGLTHAEKGSRRRESTRAITI